MYVFTYITYDWRGYFGDYIVVEILEYLKMSMLSCIVASHLTTLEDESNH